MIKHIVILFAVVFALTAGGTALAQTATTAPSPTPTTTTTVPNSPPNTGFGTLAR